MSGHSTTFQRVERSKGRSAPPVQEAVDDYVFVMAKQMVLYPVAYTFLILPVTICRWMEFSGKEMPMSVIFATNCIFLLSGMPFLALRLTIH
jgi:hypothetical protein